MPPSQTPPSGWANKVVPFLLHATFRFSYSFSFLRPALTPPPEPFPDFFLPSTPGLSPLLLDLADPPPPPTTSFSAGSQDPYLDRSRGAGGRGPPQSDRLFEGACCSPFEAPPPPWPPSPPARSSFFFTSRPPPSAGPHPCGWHPLDNRFPSFSLPPGRAVCRTRRSMFFFPMLDPLQNHSFPLLIVQSNFASPPATPKAIQFCH